MGLVAPGIDLEEYSDCAFFSTGAQIQVRSADGVGAFAFAPLQILSCGATDTRVLFSPWNEWCWELALTFGFAPPRSSRQDLCYSQE